MKEVDNEYGCFRYISRMYKVNTNAGVKLLRIPPHPDKFCFKWLCSTAYKLISFCHHLYILSSYLTDTLTLGERWRYFKWRKMYDLIF